MRKHLSVFMLFVRSGLVSTIVLSLLMAAVQISYYFFSCAGKELLVETMIDEAAFGFVFALFFALMVKWLCRACTGKGKPVYTIHRLSVSPKVIFLWQSLCNALLIFVFYAVEIFTMLFISAHFVSSAGDEYATSQTLMLAFYRSDYLHSLLPMEETSRWIRNFAIIIGMAIICANSSRKLRLGKLAIFLPAIAFAFVALTFVTDMGEGGLDGFCIAAMLIVPAVLIALVFTGGEEVEDEPVEETP